MLLVGQHSLDMAHWHMLQVPNPGYQLLRPSLQDVLGQYPGLTYVSGQGCRHSRYDEEHALHYVSKGPAAPHVPLADMLAVAPKTAFGGFTRLESLVRCGLPIGCTIPSTPKSVGGAERQLVT